MLDSSDGGSGDSVDWDHDAINQEYDTDDDEHQEDMDDCDSQGEDLDEEEEIMGSVEDIGENWDNSIITDTSAKLSGDMDRPNDAVDDNIDDGGGGIDSDGFQAMSVKSLQDDIKKGRAVKHQIGMHRTCAGS